MVPEGHLFATHKCVILEVILGSTFSGTIRMFWAITVPGSHVQWWPEVRLDGYPHGMVRRVKDYEG